MILLATRPSACAKTTGVRTVREKCSALVVIVTSLAPDYGHIEVPKKYSTNIVDALILHHLPLLSQVLLSNTK